ncbi:MAG: DNA mismatch repair protein MutS [Thermoleophilia bacterium]
MAASGGSDPGFASSAGESVLFPSPAPEVDEEPREPECLGDLNLDRVLAALAAGRERYRPAAFFLRPLTDVEGVAYRHEVLRDLERPAVRRAVTAFAEGMTRVRAHLAQAEKLHHRLQKHSWLVEAIDAYCDAVVRLDRDLGAADVASRGLRGLLDHLTRYAASERFRSLTREVRELREALAEIRYAIWIRGARVTVGDFAGEPDFGAEVEETFAKFRQGAPRSSAARQRGTGEMDHVEAQVLDCVARLHPEPFAAREDLVSRRREFVDATVARFDREVQFYLGYLDLVDRLRAGGLPFCYPEVSATSKGIAARDAFDLALAEKVVSAGGRVVTNDFRLRGPERMLVVSGPNNGGKTTFARMFGQLHYLASLGLPVPGTHARLFLPDRIFTHFERREEIRTLRGKFEDELVRVHAILERATPSSVIVMNESFGSTSLDDARLVGTAVVRRILALDALAVYVTFVDEIASLGEETVSMVSQVVPDDPAQRTFKVVRRPADGRAYAWAIAEKYGLTYERLLERIGA